MKPKIYNMKNIVFDKKTMVYIGRPRGNLSQHFGNPFSQIQISKAAVKVKSREEAVEKFEQWIRGENYIDVEPMRRQWILNNLHLLEGKHLVCWCAPHKCHGDVYFQLLKERHELHTLTHT